MQSSASATRRNVASSMLPFASDCSSKMTDDCFTRRRRPSCSAVIPSASRTALIQPFTGGVYREAGPISFRRSSRWTRDCVASRALFIGYGLYYHENIIGHSLYEINTNICHNLSNIDICIGYGLSYEPSGRTGASNRHLVRGEIKHYGPHPCFVFTAPEGARVGTAAILSRGSD